MYNQYMADFKMKLEELRFRETTEQHFGKRWMSYHGAALYVSQSTFNAQFPQKSQEKQHLKNYQVIYFDDILAEDQCQDAVSVVCLLESIVIRLRNIFPTISTMSFQSDNAQCYSTPFVMFMIPRICQVHGVTATQFIHNESGDGKTILDGHFGIQTHMIHDYVNAKHDVTTPRDVYEALTYQPLRNTLVNLIYFDNNRIEELSKAAKLVHCRRLFYDSASKLWPGWD